jgi:hypothetical protein
MFVLYFYGKFILMCVLIHIPVTVCSVCIILLFHLGNMSGKVHYSPYPHEPNVHSKDTETHVLP